MGAKGFKGIPKLGENRNPKGNLKLKNSHSTGPTTDLGKLKNGILGGMINETCNSKVLKRLDNCDLCPLRPRTEKRLVNGQETQVSIAGKCPSYNKGQKCITSQAERVRLLKYYYEVWEKYDTLALQEALTFQILSDAEMARQVEIMKDKRPGFYANKHTELAVRNMESVNRLKFGEKITTNNTNVNIDLSDDIVTAWRRRKKGDEEE